MIENNKDKKVYTVSKLNNYIKALFDGTSTLKMIHLEGEIYDLKQSGPHHYFMLKDETSSIRGVLFYSDSTKLDVRVKSGDLVLITGSVSVYPQKGQYQIYASNIALYGAGNLLLELEKLKKKLASEGLFDPDKKRPINLYPKAVGLISAKNSAAIQDMVVNLKRRYPISDIYVFDALVQGEGAPKDLIRAFNLSKHYPLDTLIIGRGGGASEDLSAFNDEMLVRAIASSNCPVISAVGHEIDTTLIDLASDKRASTPTGAVEMASVDSREILENLGEQRVHLLRSIRQKIDIASLQLAKLKERPELKNPIYTYEEKVAKIRIQRQLMLSSITKRITNYEHLAQTNSQKTTTLLLNKYQSIQKRFQVARANLEAINPRTILDLGYSITRTLDGKIIRSTEDVEENQSIETVLKDGTIISNVKETKRGE